MKNWSQVMGKAAWALLPGLSTFACLTLIISTGVAFGAANYEAPSSKQASEVLPANLRSGPHFKVQDRVMADGYMLRFTVNSDYGTFPVTGEYGLRKLIGEIQAIAALKKMSKGEALVEGVRGKAQETVEFAGNLLEKPGETLASVPQGVAKLFDNVATGFSKPREPRRDTVGESLLNVSDAKRKLAYDLGVDVYSSNRVLQNELDRLSRAQALGSMGVSAAIPYGGGTVVGLSRSSRTASEVSQLIRDESTNGLRNVNEQKLQAMGVDRSVAERFLNSTQLSPRHKTVIVASLARLSGARGKDAFLNFATQATDESSANFMQNMAEIMAAYPSPIQEISTPGIVLARAANGTVLIPFPLDYGVWTVRAERVVKNTLAGHRSAGGKCELWVTGEVSPLARQKLEAQGIKVVEHVDRRI